MVTFLDVDELESYLLINDIDDINTHYLDENLNTLMHFPQDLSVMKELIKRGGEKDATNVTGVTPIMKQYRFGTIKYLHELGSDIKKRDIYEFNISHWPKEKY